MRQLIAIFATLFLLTATLHAGDVWPDYRGPNGDGIAKDQDVPIEFGEDKNVTWKTKIHGRGWSSPVIWGDQIWMTTATEDGKEMFAICVNKKTGDIVHDIKLWDVAEPQFSNKLNSYASPSPVIEEGRVYVHFGTYGTRCINTRTGETIWQRRDLNCEHLMGPGSSPILFEDKLIFHVDGSDIQYVVALDKKTGETIWKTDRSIDYNKEGYVPDLQKAYSTPAIATVDEHLEMVSVGAQAVWGYDPHNGKELWRVRFKGYSNCTRAIFHGNLAIINTGFNKGQLYAVRLGGKGDVTDSHVAWTIKRNVGEKPTAIIIDGLLYNVEDAGILLCVDAKTGDIVWRERLAGNYSSSPIYAGGHLYFWNHEGECTVIKPGKTFEKVAVNTLESGFMASPAVADDALFVRSKTHLYRIEK